LLVVTQVTNRLKGEPPLRISARTLRETVGLGGSTGSSRNAVAIDSIWEAKARQDEQVAK
jgi:hypothetical protein